MDSERIKGLMELLAESNLLELSLTEGDTTVRLYKQAGTAQLVPPVVSERPPAAPRPKATAAVAGGEIKSSLYGVLHLTPAAGDLQQVLQLDPRALHFAQHQLGALQKLLTMVRQRHAPADPVQQATADILLQRPQRMADRALREVEILRREGETLPPRHRHERLQLPAVERAVHRAPPSSIRAAFVFE